MEKGFYHPERGYWQTIGEPPEQILAGYPEGTQEVPLKPSAEHTWDGSQWVHTPPSAEEVLAEWRASDSVSRAQFILNCLDAGILSETDAEEAVNGWPVGWDTFFEGLPARTRIEAKAEWASVTKVRRNAPLIAQLASHAGISDEQVDALFEGAT